MVNQIEQWGGKRMPVAGTDRWDRNLPQSFFVGPQSCL